MLGIFRFLYLYETRDYVLYYLLGFDFAAILKQKGWLLLINAFCSQLLWDTKNNVGGANSDAKKKQANKLLHWQFLFFFPLSLSCISLSVDLVKWEEGFRYVITMFQRT